MSIFWAQFPRQQGQSSPRFLPLHPRSHCHPAGLQTPVQERESRDTCWRKTHGFHLTRPGTLFLPAMYFLSNLLWFE